MSRIVGGVVVIAAEESDICSECGGFEELRPYGRDGALVCFKCAMKDEKEAVKQMEKHLYGVDEDKLPWKS